MFFRKSWAILAFTQILSVHALITDNQQQKRDLQPNSNLPNGWKYYGCYTDNASSHGLYSASYANDSMTESTCINFCAGQGYSFTGIEYGRECYCGYGLRLPSTMTSDSDCNMPCAGAKNEVCGGSNRLTVFTNGQAAGVVNPGVGGYRSLGCYPDSDGQRTLNRTGFLTTSASVSNCVDACRANSFTYAGVEYGQQCFCDNSIRPGVAAGAASACDMPCVGNRTEVCGGANAINIYQQRSRASGSSSSKITIAAAVSTVFVSCVFLLP